MGNDFNDKIEEPYLYSCNNIITEVNKEFIDLTGFTMDELLGRSLIEIGYMLKNNSQILVNSIGSIASIGSIGSKYCGYIFTKLLQAREVNISLFQGNEKYEKNILLLRSQILDLMTSSFLKNKHL